MDKISSPEKNNPSGIIKCRFCKSQNTVKKGFRATEKRGKIQRFICQNCKKSFCVDNGFYRMRNNEKIITMSIDMYLSNLSSRKMRNQLKRHMETKASHVSILDWVRKYVLKVHNFVDKLTPKLSGKYYMDETEIDCEGRNDFFWVAVDWDTRFIPNTHYSLFSDKRHCSKFLEAIKQKNLPKYIQTDSAVYYQSAFENVFQNEVKHIVNNVTKTGKHNVRIETVFSKIKDRVKAFRGLKALWSAPILMAGIVLQHNLIEAHTTTGKLPCELAGLKLETGVNRWLGLIRLSVNL